MLFISCEDINTVSLMHVMERNEGADHRIRQQASKQVRQDTTVHTQAHMYVHYELPVEM